MPESPTTQKLELASEGEAGCAMEDEVKIERVRFYGANDLATGFHAPRAVEIGLKFEPADPPTDIIDVLELHNVWQYIEHNFIPESCTSAERTALTTASPKMRATIARFFSRIDSSNFAAIVAGIGHDYRADLLELLGRSKVFDRCDSSIVLPVLKAVGISLAAMLANKELVRAYDMALRNELLASRQSAELLIRRYLEKGASHSINLLQNFTRDDSRGLLERYVNGDEANLNYLRLLADANDHAGAGIDAKLRLLAKRRAEYLNAEIFTDGEGFRTGTEVGIADEQDAPATEEVDSSEGWTQRYSYSRRWLDQTMDFPSILNNFQHLFKFADPQGLLSFPAYPAAFGVMERLMGLTGTTEYKIGSAFRATDSSSLLQTHMYRHFLKSKDIELEDVIGWFFGTYLVDEFKAENFSFHPSVTGSSYLEKVRHLFAEMESVSNQFALYAENGELDRELLNLGSDPVRYKEIPSSLDGKYAYSTDSREIAAILHLLFSDQSSLLYINESLRDRSFASLLLHHEIAYASFRVHQRADLDFLTEAGILAESGGRIRFVSGEQFGILMALFNTEAVNFYHLSKEGRQELEKMVDKGWVLRRSSLLSRAEGDYFNYFLNHVGFSNGPNLRNSYLHGSQIGDDDGEHFNTYLVALRLMVALIIKMNDDFCLLAGANSGSAA